MTQAKSSAVKIAKILIFYVSVGLLGVLIAFHPMLLSGFTKLQADTGDTRLNNYFLEHSFQFVFNRNYGASLWSPTFFYPFQNVLAFSDNLFGTAPLYWLLRAFFLPDIAYQLWLIACAFLCYICFAVFCRSFRVSHILSAFGGLVFGFGLLKMGRLWHAQLLPQFFTPLAFLLIWKFFRKPTSARLCLALTLIFLQVLAGIYLGWFLLFSLLIFIPLLLYFDRSSSAAVIEYGRNHWRFTIAAIAVWGIALFALLSPYLQIAKLIGGRSFDDVKTMLPRLSSWVFPPPKTLWFSILAPSNPLPMFHEHWIFMGFTVFALVGFSLYVLRFKQTVLTDEKAILVKVFLATAFITIILSLYIFDFSLWKIVYKFVPGATAIRAVSRIALIVEFFLLAASLICLDSFFKHSTLTRRTVSTIALLIFSVGVLENTIFEPSSYSRAPILKVEAELEELMRQGCEVAYTNLIPGQERYNNQQRYNAQQLIEIWAGLKERRDAQQLTAMWAGLKAGVPVINGSSGSQPPTFPGSALETLRFTSILQWLQSFKPDQTGRLCLLASTDDPLTVDRQLEAGISLESIRGATQYFSRDRNYTAFVVPLSFRAFLPDYAQSIRAVAPAAVTVNQAIELPMIVQNTSRSTWLQTPDSPIRLSYRWLDAQGKLDSGEGIRSALPTLPPGQAIALNAVIKAPNQPGQYVLRLSVVQEFVTWFFQRGAKPLDFPVTVVR